MFKQSKGDNKHMSIRERKGKKGVSYQVYFPYKNELGVTCTYRKGGFKTKKEAKTHETLIKAQIAKDGFLKIECKLTLNEVFNDYYNLIKKKDLSTGTLKLRQILYNNYIEPTIGNYGIVKIKYQTLQNLFNNLTRVSLGTQKNIKSVLNLVFTYACRCGYIENNPVPFIELTSKAPVKVNAYLTDNQFNQIIEILENKRTRDKFKLKSTIIAFYISFYTGLRISEALALEKNDFDFINNEIHVNKQLDCFGKRKDKISIKAKLKTSASNAVIPLAEPLKEILVDWFKVNPYDHVICDVNGNYIHSGYIRSLNPYIKKILGIDFHFHMLRHTFVSNLANKGISPQIAKELARHSDIATTMNIYTHVNEDSQKQAINAVFGSESVKKVSNPVLLTN